jgi:alginate O-acetyltransferase complex protein AlgI
MTSKRFFTTRDVQSSSRWREVMGWFFTFHTVLIGWVFFRAKCLSDAFYILWHLLGVLLPGQQKLLFGVRPIEIAVTAALAALLLTTERLLHSAQWRSWSVVQSRWQRWSVYYAALLIILIFGKFNSYEFIYFQF